MDINENTVELNNNQDELSTLSILDNYLNSIKTVKSYWLNRNSQNELDQHATKIIKMDYESSLKKSYSEPKHLIYIFKINQMLNLIVELLDKPAINLMMQQWFNVKDQAWKFAIFKTMIMMSDEIQMMLEQNWEFSSLAKVRQYFELYALYHLTSKYGSHVYDCFISHGLRNMDRFIKYFDNKYSSDLKHTVHLTTHQIRSPYGWMQKIKHMDPQDRKIKHIIHKAIEHDEFLKHIYLQSNFPHHASSFMFAAYLSPEQTKMMKRYTKKMVFHTYVWLLDILLNNVKYTLKNILRKNKSQELKTLHKMFKIIHRYLSFTKVSAGFSKVK